MSAISRALYACTLTFMAMVFVFAGGSAQALAEPPALKLVTDIPLGEATRRFDYESLDPKTGLLFLADLSGGRVLVVDIRANRLIKVIPEVNGAHGVLAVPEQGRVYASATGAREVVTIDEKTLTVIGRGPGGRYPDGIAWASTKNKLYVSDESGKAVNVIDPGANQLMRQIPMGGEVGNTQFNKTDGLIYSNEQTTSQLVAIDPATDRITGRWPLAGCEEGHGLLLDTTRQIAYIACQANAKLVVFSLKTHAITVTLPIAARPDVMAADFGRHRLYVASETGVVSVLDISAPTPRKIGEAKIADNAHVVAVDPATHRVYLPLRNEAGQAVLRVMAPN